MMLTDAMMLMQKSKTTFAFNRKIPEELDFNVSTGGSTVVTLETLATQLHNYDDDDDDDDDNDNDDDDDDDEDDNDDDNDDDDDDDDDDDLNSGCVPVS